MKNGKRSRKPIVIQWKDLPLSYRREVAATKQTRARLCKNPPTENQLDDIYTDWALLGAGFYKLKKRPPPDLEKCIIQTAFWGRFDARILFGCIQWIINNGDLIDINRLISMIPKDDSAVLGGMLDLALEKGADKHLKRVMKNCKPYKKKEFLYNTYAEHPGLISLLKIITWSLPLWRRWGIYNRSSDFPRIWYNRKYVLENNPELARRDKEKKKK